MLPLLSAIIIGANQRPNSLRALGLSFAYVPRYGTHPYIIGINCSGNRITISNSTAKSLRTGQSIRYFILLALSMFGVFTLQLPSSLQTKLTLLSQQQKERCFWGCFCDGNDYQVLLPLPVLPHHYQEHCFM